MSIIYSMKKIKDFFNSHRQVFVWSVCYAVVVWAVLRFLFNFDVFMWRSWVRLIHMELHGFGGLAFGMFVLSAVPLYFATTIVVARTKSAPVPFKIPLPRWLRPEVVPEQKTKEEPVKISEREEIILPTGAPKEMREAFIRARRNVAARHQYSVFNKPETDKDVAEAKEQVQEKIEPVLETVHQDSISAQKKAVIAAAPKNNLRKKNSDTTQDTSNGLPLPDSFDVKSDNVPSFDTPVFSEINFDDDDSDTDSRAGESNTTPTPTAEEKLENKTLKKILNKLGVKVRGQNGLFLSDKFAIALHDDDDLWIADDIDWFAAGKQKPSPIAALKNAQTQYGVTPVLFLDNANIMDSDKLITAWNADGIQVAQSADELEKILKVAE